MTKQADIVGDEKYRPVLDHGFVGVVDTMGSDAAVVQAARVSYGAGTKTVNEDRGLIRYLMRKRHTSPFEMNEVKLHLKCPIFVFRQLVRHRTSSLNEESARYSVVSDEFYLPEPEVIQAQSRDNKQGRADVVEPVSQTGVRWLMNASYTHAYDTYKTLLGGRDPAEFRESDGPMYDAYSSSDALLDAEFGGVARELARSVLPVGTYSEMYWKQNLHNLMHMLKLRLDPHSQHEIRVFADAIHSLLIPSFPLCFEAFEDYVRGALTVSRMEHLLLCDILASPFQAGIGLNQMVAEAGSEKDFAAHRGLSLREFREFRQTFRLAA